MQAALAPSRAEVHRVRIEVEADVAPIKMITTQLAKSLDYIRLATAKNWNGYH